jgi:ATP-dependent Clp protease ATP-binding subunit ClpA
VVLAQEEARELSQNYIGTEHVLRGLIREEEGIGARTLESLDVTLEGVRGQIVQIVGRGEEETAGQVPFTPRAKKVLELALREALRFGHDYIGTEHILLGLVRENQGVAARILLDFDADAEKVRNEVTRILSGSSRRPAVQRPESGFEQWIRVGPSAGLRPLLRGAAARALDDDRSEIEVSDVLLELTRQVDDATVRDAIKRRGLSDDPPEAAPDD